MLGSYPNKTSSEYIKCLNTIEEIHEKETNQSVFYQLFISYGIRNLKYGDYFRCCSITANTNLINKTIFSILLEYNRDFQYLESIKYAICLPYQCIDSH